jgi:AraC-like DNA-binding protein
MKIHTNKKFNNYNDMANSALNWDFNCNYQLLPTALNGEHTIIELSKIQLSYSYRAGGMMYDIKAPKDAISIGVVDECADRALYDRLKLKKGYIVLFDDSRAFRFMSYGSIKISIISIDIAHLSLISDNIIEYIGGYIHDTNSILSKSLNSLLLDYKDGKNIDNRVEDTIIDIVANLIKNQSPNRPKLTQGEIITLNIVDDMIEHMDGKVDINAFSKKYDISNQTLQNSFRSLFGFSAKQFLILLKLNHVHNDLYNASTTNSTVLSIATKWGFTHMGNFSRYYKKLFEELPSTTLKNSYQKIDIMSDECVLRREEID